MDDKSMFSPPWQKLIDEAEGLVRRADDNLREAIMRASRLANDVEKLAVRCGSGTPDIPGLQRAALAAQSAAQSVKRHYLLLQEAELGLVDAYECARGVPDDGPARIIPDYLRAIPGGKH